MQRGQIEGMKPHDLRRTNLLRLIEERFDGNKGRFADAIGRKRPQVYRLFSDAPASRRDIGEELAREIEKQLGLPKGALDAETEQPDPLKVARANMIDDWLQQASPNTRSQLEAIKARIDRLDDADLALLEQLLARLEQKKRGGQ